MTKLFLPIKSHSVIKESQTPNLDDLEIERRFGKTPFYLLYDTETEEIQFIPNTNHHFGGPDSPTDIVLRNKAEVVIANHMGLHPYSGFQRNGIGIKYTELNNPLKKIIELYNSNQLEEFPTPGEKSCSDHNHDHSH